MDAELEQFVWQRADGRCEYCRFPADIALLPFQMDHIIAEKHGGPTVPDNRVMIDGTGGDRDYLCWLCLLLFK